MYLQKKKIQKKVSQENEKDSKSMMSSFVKGFQAAVRSKKEQTLSED